jgi:hypothetical protein
LLIDDEGEGWNSSMLIKMRIDVVGCGDETTNPSVENEMDLNRRGIGQCNGEEMMKFGAEMVENGMFESILDERGEWVLIQKHGK